MPARPPTPPCSCGREGGLPALYVVNDEHRWRYEDAKPRGWKDLPARGKLVCELCDRDVLHVNLAHSVELRLSIDDFLRRPLNMTRRILRAFPAAVHPYPADSEAARASLNRPPKDKPIPESTRALLIEMERHQKAGSRLAGPASKTDVQPPTAPPVVELHACDKADAALEAAGLKRAFGILAKAVNDRAIPSRHVFLQFLSLAAGNAHKTCKTQMTYRDQNIGELLNMLAVARFRSTKQALETLRGPPFDKGGKPSNERFWKHTNFPIPILFPGLKLAVHQKFSSCAPKNQ